MTTSPKTREQVYALHQAGYTRTAIGMKTGLSAPTVRKILSAPMGTPLNGQQARFAREQDALPAPLTRAQLSAPASRSLDDFAYFRWRYMGRRSTPWQEEAAYSTVEWLLSPETELVVVNAAPGSGKSTLFTCDIPLWLIVRNRAIRCFVGHRSMSKSRSYAMRIRKALERTRPLPPDPAQGRMESAEGCLARDFGRFRPGGEELWTQTEFSVLAEYGDDESVIENKESTVTAEAAGSEFLGIRSEFVAWDDLVTSEGLRNADRVEEMNRWWRAEGVTRVEPGGCLILCGQRMGAADLYRTCLDEKVTIETDDGDIVDTDEDRYRHILYPAHFDERCKGKHGRGPEYSYPEGCLLDPVRIPWSGKNGLLTVRRNSESVYAVQYQQRDTDPAEVLVDPLWIEGGKDHDGIEYPGCWDRHRGLCDIPKGLASPWFSIATADPSPSKYWAVEWWLYHPASQQRFLLDLTRQSMEAGEFLDWNANEETFVGLAEDWQNRSRLLGFPITHWIVEANAAQRFLLQYDHTKRWQRKHRVLILPHYTTVRKLDDEYGIQMLANLYKFGNVRLPGKNTRVGGIKDTARTASMKLVWEATHYPSVSTTDCLMAQYFLEFNLPALAKPQKELPNLPRPRYLVGVA